MSIGFVSSRHEYGKGTIDIKKCPKDPLVLFAEWLEHAANEGVYEPGAMVLSTVGEDNRPSSRVILFKGLVKGGIRFYSHYSSQKGSHLDQNPFGSIVFYWAELERQIRIEGRVERLPELESEAYFATRPTESQLSAILSKQSQIIGNFELYKQSVKELAERVKSNPSLIKRPSTWGGYSLIPDRFEFWQGGPARMNDRINYIFEENSWIKQRLYP